MIQVLLEQVVRSNVYLWLISQIPRSEYLQARVACYMMDVGGKKN